ncbi:MAG: hypothetical protein JW976_15700 [Syntrophaceae bacterium]|nr:hypothetical protein [Syntrophaceae bacterium]
MKKEKTYNILSSVNDNVLEVIIKGDISSLNSHQTMLNEMLDIEKSANVNKQLVDIRKLKGRLTTIELYSLVRDYPADRPRMIIALVDTPEYAETASFHETTAFNAAIKLKWFTDIDKAREWLKGK